MFDSRIIINSTAEFYISISYLKDLLFIDTRIFTLFCSFLILFTIALFDIKNLYSFGFGNHRLL